MSEKHELGQALLYKTLTQLTTLYSRVFMFCAVATSGGERYKQTLS